jgi:hypothetical protein
VARQKLEPMVESLIDFSDISNDEKISILFPGPNAGEILEIRPFERLVTLVSAALSQAVDFMQVLSTERIVLASETGTVLIINPQTKEVVDQVSFPNAVWVESLSAHLIGDKTHIWAIDARSKHIFHWESDSNSKQFVLSPEQLPDTIQPKQIVSTGQLLPVGFNLEKNSTGFYSQVSAGTHEVEIERVLVIANDGSIHALVGSQSNSLIGEPVQDKTWVSHPF